MVADFFESLDELGGEIALDPHVSILLIEAEVPSKQSKGLLFLDFLPAVEQAHCFGHFGLRVPLDALKKLDQHFLVLLLAIAEAPDHKLVFF